VGGASEKRSSARREISQRVSPKHPVYGASTFSGIKIFRLHSDKKKKPVPFVDRFFYFIKNRATMHGTAGARLFFDSEGHFPPVSERLSLKRRGRFTSAW